MLQHFADLQRAKVRTIVVSWWGQVHKQESTDNQELSTDLTVALLLTLADVTLRAVSVCFHLEPHPGRSASSTLEVGPPLLSDAQEGGRPGGVLHL
jgi:hypothetical protein